ncbi:MAG: 2-dehydropantoate 2-reductase [Rhodospirillaceae bacterium]|nr:MAG: 2-dehydropantoate 2-reductase [Rhodospirillaceae bacterium]
MKFCVFGAGAVGGFVGGMVARGYADVSLVARGANLSSLQANGLKVITQDDEFVVDVPATDTPGDLGIQDVIFLSAKAHSLTIAAEAMQPLIGPDTVVVSAQNGVPFWYFYAHGGDLEGHTLQTVDPGARIASAIGNQRVIGCVITSSNIVEAPGVVRNIGNRVFALGEPDGTQSGRLSEIAALLETAGLSAPTGGDIRSEVWIKMWGNVSFSPMAVLTMSKLGPLVKSEHLKSLGIAIMEEVQAVGEALGVEFTATIAERLEGTLRVAGHKTSILQDLEAGRPMEVDGITGAVVELGRLLGVETPMINLVYALMRQRAREAGLYLEIGVDPLAS